MKFVMVQWTVDLDFFSIFVDDGNLHLRDNAEGWHSLPNPRMVEDRRRLASSRLCQLCTSQRFPRPAVAKFANKVIASLIARTGKKKDAGQTS